ncbi:MAG: hypothetical protein ACYDDO_14540 [Acidiferrobacterales bacterium]
MQRIMGTDVRIQVAQVEESIFMNGEVNRIDPEKWRPLIMSFRQFYGLGPQLEASMLAKIPESLYRSPDMDRWSTRSDGGFGEYRTNGAGFTRPNRMDRFWPKGKS